MEKYLNFYNTCEKSISYFLLIYYYQQRCEHFKTFYITQNLELYIKRKLTKFLTTYVHDVCRQSLVLKLLASCSITDVFILIVSKVHALSGPERQVPDRSGTNQIAGFHVPDRSRKQSYNKLSLLSTLIYLLLICNLVSRPGFRSVTCFFLCLYCCHRFFRERLL